MIERTITRERAWNTWDDGHPAGLVYLPIGFRLRLGAYSTVARSGAWLQMSAAARLGHHGLHGEYLDLQTVHAGSTMGIEYAKPDDATVLGMVSLGPLAEWGLRFWLLLAAGFDGAEAQPGRVLGASPCDPRVFLFHRRSVYIALACADRPLRAGRYVDAASDLAHLESHGYFAPHPDEPEGTWSVLRFNGEETPRVLFCLAAGASAESATSRALAGLAGGPDALAAARRQLADTRPAVVGGPFAGALEAIGDVVAWNTVWDRFNHRPYTTLTRQWVPVKFGGWITWMNDMGYHALLAAHVDREVAEQNVRTLLSMATPEGNLACLLSEHDEWVDRSQPPAISYLLWLIHLRAGAASLLELSYPTLAANHRWWFAHRDGNGNGLLEYGTSGVGTGLFAGTKLACKDESTMDNSPLWDAARFVPEVGTLDVEDVGLNSMLALDAEMLSLIAGELGRPDEARAWHDQAARLRERLGALWDEARGIFANRHWDGRWSDRLAPTSFYPLLAGAATSAQAARMIAEHLLNPEEFWGQWVLPSIAHNDPAASDNVYWRGRIWPPLVFLVCQGLRRYGYDEVAQRVAERSMDLFMREWHAHRHCCENFNATTGEGCDSADTDPFYTWGALLPLLGCADLIDVSPWRGLELGGDPAGATQAVRALRLRDGIYRYTLGDGWRTLERDGTPVLRTDAVGRLTGVQVAPTHAALQLPPQDRPATVQWTSVERVRVVIATVDGEAAALEEEASATLRLPPDEQPRQIALLFHPL